MNVMEKRKPLGLGWLRTADRSACDLVAIPTQLQSDMRVKVRDLKCDKFAPLHGLAGKLNTVNQDLNEKRGLFHAPPFFSRPKKQSNDAVPSRDRFPHPAVYLLHSSSSLACFYLVFVFLCFI